VVGIEGDLEGVSASGSGTGFIAGVPIVTGHADFDWQASLRGRVGVASGRTLFYATAGAAWAGVNFGYTFPIVGGVTDSFSKTMTGFTVGGGIEHAIDRHWTARIEYRFTDFGDANGSIINCCAPPPNHQHHELDANAIRGAVSYKF
jgi:outer membrane immunogenic protein